MDDYSDNYGGHMARFKYRLINFVLTCIVILAADLLIVLINKKVMSLGKLGDRRLIVLAGMILVLAIFYFVVKWVSRFSEWFADKFVHVSRVYLGRVMGLYISVAVLFLLIFAGYYYAWFDVNLFLNPGLLFK